MSQPEARLGAQIRKALTERGAFVFKVHGGPMMMAGLPDLIVCYRGRYIGVEVKMPGNKPSAVQLRVHEQMRRAGATVVVAYSVEDALASLHQITITPEDIARNHDERTTD